MKKRLFPLGKKGFSMVELVVAMTVLAIVVPAITALLNWSVVQMVKAREHTRASRLAQMITAHTRSMDFFNIIVTTPTTGSTGFVNSAMPNFGLPVVSGFGPLGNSPYPDMGHLNQFQQQVRQAGFTFFTIDVVHMHRAVGTNDLIPFAPNFPGGLVDANDPALFYQDTNGDSFYGRNDTANNISEQPNTRIKQVTVRIFRNGELFADHTDLLSAEMFSGRLGVSAESQLRLSVAWPSDVTRVWRAHPSRGLAMLSGKVYSANSLANMMQGEFGAPMVMDGNTEPAAQVQTYLSTTTNLTDILLDTGLAGTFSAVQLPTVTGSIVEGANEFWARTFKDAFASPFYHATFILDLRPPVISARTPADLATVQTASPFIGAVFQDDTTSTDAVSGLCDEVLDLSITPAPPKGGFRQVPGGYVVWSDTTTFLPVQLANGVYNVQMEGGDFAGYKSSSSWQFTINSNAMDASSPTVVSFSANPTNVRIVVDDPDSGLDGASLILEIDGVVRLDGTTPGIGQHFDANPASAGNAGVNTRATIDLPISLPPGAHTYRLRIKNWAALQLELDTNLGCGGIPCGFAI